MNSRLNELNQDNLEKTVFNVTPASLFNPNPDVLTEATNLKDEKHSSFQQSILPLFIDTRTHRTSYSTTRASLWAPQTLGTQSKHHSRRHFDYTSLLTSHKLSLPVSNTKSLHTPTHTLTLTSGSEGNSTLAMLLLQPVTFAPSGSVKKLTPNSTNSGEAKPPAVEIVEILEAIRLGISKFGNLNSLGLKEMMGDLTGAKDTEKQKLIHVKNTAEYHSSEIIHIHRFSCCFKEEPEVAKLQEFYKLVKNLDLRNITPKRIQRFKNQLVNLHETPFVIKKRRKKTA